MSVWLTAGLLALSLFGKIEASKPVEAPLPTAPAFLWSPYHCFSSSSPSDTSRVTYEVVPASSLSAALAGQGSLSHLLNMKEVTAQAPDAIIAFLGGSATAHDLGRGAGTWAPLKAVLKGSGSSLSLPYVSSKEGSSVASDVVEALAGTGLHPHTLSLSAPSEWKHLLTPSPSAPKVLVFPLQEYPSDQQVEAVLKVQEEVTAVAQRPLFLYASEPQEDVRVVRRRLQQQETLEGGLPVGTNQEVPLCGPKCETQVKLLEAFILAVTLLVALGSGTAMLGALQAPTMFETAKDAAPSS